jgi:hypothetical protein
MHFLGTKGRIESRSRSTPKDRPCRIFIDDGGELFGGISTETFPTCDQYDSRRRLFRAVRDDGQVRCQSGMQLNMAVIEAISARRNQVDGNAMAGLKKGRQSAGSTYLSGRQRFVCQI